MQRLTMEERLIVLRLAETGAITMWTRSPGPAVKADDGDDDESGAGGDDDPDDLPKSTDVIASTEAADRYDDIIVQAGWELDNFKANPVIQPAHDYSVPPVGKGLDLVIHDNLEAVKGPALTMTIHWNLRTQAGRDWAASYGGGYVRGTSVGFRPLSWAMRSALEDGHPAKSDYGFFIQTAELLELSTAPVPVQQEALAAKAMGLPPGQRGLVNVNGSAPADQDDFLVVTAGKGMSRQVFMDALCHALRTHTPTRQELLKLNKALKMAAPDPNFTPAPNKAATTSESTDDQWAGILY